MSMNDWLKANTWPLVIAAATIISTYTLYGYRIAALEKEAETTRVAIVALDAQQNQINVQLAQISTDIQYIKINIDRLFGKSP